VARVSEVLLKVKADNASIKKTRKSLSTVEDSLEQWIDALEEGKRLAKEQQKAQAAAAKNDPTKQQTKDQKKFNEELKKSVTLGQLYDQGRSKATRNYGYSGDIDTSVNTVSTALGGNSTLRGVADLSAIYEQINLMSVSFVNVGKNVADTDGLLGKFASR
jgi:hypothetical protein